MVVRVDRPVDGPVETLGLPVKVSATPGAAAGPAPWAGEPGRLGLAEAGLGPEEIAALPPTGAAIETRPPEGRASQYSSS